MTFGWLVLLVVRPNRRSLSSSPLPALLAELAPSQGFAPKTNDLILRGSLPLVQQYHHVGPPGVNAFVDQHLGQKAPLDIDPDFQEHLHREQIELPELRWAP